MSKLIYLLYVAKICLLTLLKISYEVFISLLLIVVLMASIRLVVGDKYYFTKKLEKLKSYIYGI